MYMQGSTVIIARKGGLVQSIDKVSELSAALIALPLPCLYLCLRVLHAFDHSSHCGILGVLQLIAKILHTEAKSGSSLCQLCHVTVPWPFMLINTVSCCDDVLRANVD